jgi:hypothetical protein
MAVAMAAVMVAAGVAMAAVMEAAAAGAPMEAGMR